MTGPGDETNSLEPMFKPVAVAVVGASAEPEKLGGRPVRYLKERGYAGAIYPINPRHAQVQGLKAYKSVLDVEGPIDLALISTPAALVEQAVTECAEKGIKGVVIFSSGFAELGEEGRAAQQRLADIGAEAGMRIIGPNCMGIASFEQNMVITFGMMVHYLPPEIGPISIVSQSGAFGGLAYTEARQRHLGVRLWATTGNECDVSFADCLDYFVGEEGTEVVLLYFESTKSGGKILSALEKARSLKKPVVVMKVGSSEVGREAALSHTDSLTGSDDVLDAVFQRYNAYRAYSIDEFFDIGYACTLGRFPAGNRIGFVTISGGVGVLMADVADKLGLDVAAMPGAAQERVRQVLPYTGTRNPVDITGQTLVQPEILEQCLDIMIEDGGYDIIVVYLAGMTSSPPLKEAALAVFHDVRSRHPDTVMIVAGKSDDEIYEALTADGYLIIDEPTRAVKAAAALMQFGRGYARTGDDDPPPVLAAPGIEIPDGPINELDAMRLLGAAGIPIAEERLATSADEAAAAAQTLGLPVAMKLVSPDILHKSEIGGVLLDVASAVEAGEGYATLTERAAAAAPDARLDGVLVAPMVAGGVETILGVKRDPDFGPAVIFGLGGVFVEVLGDVARRMAPFGEAEALEMIREVKGYPLLEGVRGGAPADIEALAAALAKLSVFADATSDRIESIDLNPFIVLPAGQGALAVDALIVPRRES